jgi:hypothetical protein
MLPVKIKDETVSLKKPPDWDDERDGSCGELSVRIEPFGTRCKSFYSNWKPSPDELTILNNGGVVEIEVVGQGQPPLSVGAVEQYK